MTEEEPDGFMATVSASALCQAGFRKKQVGDQDVGASGLFAGTPGSPSGEQRSETRKEGRNPVCGFPDYDFSQSRKCPPCPSIHLPWGYRASPKPSSPSKTPST